MHLTPDDYDSWRCTVCTGECKAEWQFCDCCQGDDPNCEECGGFGGGYICIHDKELEPSPSIPATNNSLSP